MSDSLLCPWNSPGKITQGGHTATEKMTLHSTASFLPTHSEGLEELAVLAPGNGGGPHLYQHQGYLERAVETDLSGLTPGISDSGGGGGEEDLHFSKMHRKGADTASSGTPL